MKRVPLVTPWEFKHFRGAVVIARNTVLEFLLGSDFKHSFLDLSENQHDQFIFHRTCNWPNVFSSSHSLFLSLYLDLSSGALLCLLIHFHLMNIHLKISSVSRVFLHLC